MTENNMLGYFMGTKLRLIGDLKNKTKTFTVIWKWPLYLNSVFVRPMIENIT
jgi:hypothetical protein